MLHIYCLLIWRCIVCIMPCERGHLVSCIHVVAAEESGWSTTHIYLAVGMEFTRLSSTSTHSKYDDLRDMRCVSQEIAPSSKCMESIKSIVCLSFLLLPLHSDLCLVAICSLFICFFLYLFSGGDDVDNLLSTNRILSDWNISIGPSYNWDAPFLPFFPRVLFAHDHFDCIRHSVNMKRNLA